MKLFVILCSLLAGVIFCSNNNNNKSCHPKKRWKGMNDEELLLPNQQPNTAATNDADPLLFSTNTTIVFSNSELPLSLSEKKISNFSIEAILSSTDSNKKNYSDFSIGTILSSTNLSKTTLPNGGSLSTLHESTDSSVESVSFLPPNEIGQMPVNDSNTTFIFSDTLSIPSPKQPVIASTPTKKNDNRSSQKLPGTNEVIKRKNRKNPLSSPPQVTSLPPNNQPLTLFLSLLNSPLVKLTDDYFGFSGTNIRNYSYKSDYCISALDNKSFSYKTNEFNRLLRFRYTSYTYTIFFKNSEFLSNISEELLNKTFEALFSVINSIEPHLQPFFHMFKFTNDIGIINSECLEVPTYFIFTAISYLMKEPENSAISTTLKALLEIYFHQKVDHIRMAKENWALVASYLDKYFPIPQPQEPSKRKNYLRFSLSTLAFIHSEMRKNSNSVEAKSFFTESWKACYKRSFHWKLLPASIDQKFETSFPNYEMIDVSISAFHKFYQIKFTELVFGNWNRISELLDEYFKLVSEFGRDIDFRRRVFNRIDFEELKNGLGRIEELIKGCNSEDLPKLFFHELEYFVNFKSFQFLYDLHNEMKVSSNKIFEYKQTIETIGQVDQILKRIKQNIPTKTSSSDSTNENSLFPLFPINELLGKFSVPILTGNSSNSNEIETPINDLNEAMKSNSSEFSKTLIYLPGGMSRFQCAEFIAQITEAIKSNSRDEINKIFQSDELMKLKELMSFFPKKYLSKGKTLYESRKTYLKELSTYLHYFTQ